ncbi:hypothetical protein [Streptomyces liangshanensis]|uniref:hypothetical protein n=1 Tax=Streptomyces liangshanensis TaxID=2717324 RepID=UPI0036DBB409
MSGVFEADPAALRRGIEGMRALPLMARQLGADFRAEENTYTEWPGWTDDFARSVRPRYNDNNEYCLRIGTALHDALDALVAATLMNLESIEGARNDAVERIEDHRRRTADPGPGSGGPGGGKH